ncbi:MAG: hypothetical protein K5778_02350 [Bacteroidaceae bacterium]|nr:hypothetical protein [Bacteroidaceae bacterium]
MKRIIYFMALSLCAGMTSAQDTYESVDLGSSDLNGTARYVGMGGALSALGGDITTMGTNPAGTALFRHNEIALTLGGVFTDEKGQLGHDASRMSFDQAGIVFTMDQSDASGRGLQYLNFGINYMKKRNHLGNFNVANVGGLDAGNFSQTWQIADMANQAQNQGFKNEEWPEMAAYFTPTFTSAGVCNNDGVVGYDAVNDTYVGIPAQSAAYQRATYGSNSQFDFNLSFNVSNQYFWGLSLGVYSQNYKRQSFYAETSTGGRYYDVVNWYDSKADGFDIKFGFICRPIEDSPFRFGITVHTPIWYSMDDVNGWNFVDKGNNYQSPNLQYDPFRYSYRTPWKFGLSLGHTIGKDLAFGLEYELTDPSTARYFTEKWDRAPYFTYVNEKIKSSLKAQHTLKVGIECKIVPEFSLRVGYNFVSSPIKSTAFRMLDAWYDTYATETAYINWKDLHRVTLGFGYRFKGGYFDVAYQYQAQKGDFYAFDGDYTDAGKYYSFAPTSVKNNRSQLLATLGFSF